MRIAGGQAVQTATGGISKGILVVATGSNSRVKNLERTNIQTIENLGTDSRPPPVERMSRHGDRSRLVSGRNNIRSGRASEERHRGSETEQVTIGRADLDPGNDEKSIAWRMVL